MKIGHLNYFPVFSLVIFFKIISKPRFIVAFQPFPSGCDFRGRVLRVDVGTAAGFLTASLPLYRAVLPGPFWAVLLNWPFCFVLFGGDRGDRPCVSDTKSGFKMQYEKFNPHDSVIVLFRLGSRLTRIPAPGICRGLISGYLFSGAVAWFLMWFVEDIYPENCLRNRMECKIHSVGN